MKVESLGFLWFLNACFYALSFAQEVVSVGITTSPWETFTSFAFRIVVESVDCSTAWFNLFGLSARISWTCIIAFIEAHEVVGVTATSTEQEVFTMLSCFVEKVTSNFSVTVSNDLRWITAWKVVTKEIELQTRFSYPKTFLLTLRVFCSNKRWNHEDQENCKYLHNSVLVLLTNFKLRKIPKDFCFYWHFWRDKNLNLYNSGTVFKLRIGFCLLTELFKKQNRKKFEQKLFQCR